MTELAQIVEELSARVNALEHENAQLRERSPRPVSRRNALRLGVLGAGAAGAAVFLRPGTAGATTGAMSFGADNDAGVSSTGLTSTNGTDTLHVVNSDAGKALTVRATDGANAADALSVVHDGTGTAIHAQTTNGSGDAITAIASNGAGVSAFASPGGPGIGSVAEAGTFPAIEALIVDPSANATSIHSDQGGTGHGIASSINNANNGNRALYGATIGTGQAVTGGIRNASSSASAIFGGTNGTGAAIEGKSGNGVGGKFTGKTAQVQLVPSTASTHPASGASGQLFVDSHHRLWYCFGGASWKQLA